MCFSAEMSFGAGIALAGIGIVAIKKNKQPSLRLVALIPLIFAVQQVCEGFLWLSFHGTISLRWQSIFMMLFLVFAQVIWTTWVPVAFLIAEKKTGRKKILAGLSVAGIILSLYHIFCLVNFPVSVEVTSNHIRYIRQFPHIADIPSGIIYIAATIFPAFVSSLKKANVLAIFNLVSFLVTAIFYREYVISVWCFFAAIISGLILYVLSVNQKTLLTDSSQ
jgi:hypothetical protein